MVGAMRKEARGDVWKVWYYAAASVFLGAWMSPLLYNAGKALAEVSSSKATNGPLELLAKLCREAEFPRFYEAGLLLGGVILFLPWMEWIHAKRGDRTGSQAGPWLLRLPDGARMSTRGQPLRRSARGLWQASAGFLLVAGLVLSMGTALVPAGLFTLRATDSGLATLAIGTFGVALVLAALMEVFFRGIVMGIFLRAMRPAAALGMSATFFALIFSLVPPSGVNVVDPEASGTGFEMLRLVAGRFADWNDLWGNFIPLLALGGVLAYARWRTGSLWMPIGLHTGWIFAKSMLSSLLVPVADLKAALPAVTGSIFQHGVIPMVGILLAGLLTHYLTVYHDDDEGALRS
jgi:membrane protease YdiL (CAAX protease family)